MTYQYIYKSETFINKDLAESLHTRLSPYAGVIIVPSEGGFIVTCVLGDEDELSMIEYEEMRWMRGN